MVVSEAPARCLPGPADLAGAQALSAAAGWNQTADDWGFFLGQGQVLGRRSDADGTLVATAAALPYVGGQGWISMVLVDAGWRHRGLASELLGGCVDLLRASGHTPVLDATPAGAAVYRRLGFVAGFEFERWEVAAVTASAAGAARSVALDEATSTQPVDASLGDLATIAALDAASSRIDRRPLLAAFLGRPGTRAWLCADGSGFVIARAGLRAMQIGPLVARDAAAAIGLLQAVLCAVPGPMFIDVPVRCTSLLAWLRGKGFRHQRPFVRMALRDAPALAGSETLFAVAGPEFG